jgi:hypothetical protein
MTGMAIPIDKAHATHFNIRLLGVFFIVITTNTSGWGSIAIACIVVITPLVNLNAVSGCKTAWKNVQGIGENSVENCPPRYVS